MKISIGILTYGRVDEFRETIECLLNTNLELEIVILNNNEKESGVLNFLESKLTSNFTLNYIWDSFNYGVASGRRKLVEATKSDVMILLDDDVYLPNFNIIIEKVISEFESDSLLGGIAFNIKQFSDGKSNRYEIPHKDKDFQLNKKQETYIMIGAGHAIDIRKAKIVDSYPDDFGLYGFEEVYLSLKMINSGYKIKYIPECVVFHKKSPDGRFSNKKVSYLAYRNRMIIASRHLKIRYILSCYIIRTLYFLLKGGEPKQVSEVTLNSFREFRENRNAFGFNFYHRVRMLKGFLWY